VEVYLRHHLGILLEELRKATNNITVVDLDLPEIRQNLTFETISSIIIIVIIINIIADISV
jgi:hypothetical protein